MSSRVLEIEAKQWQFDSKAEYVNALESGKVLCFSGLPFELSPDEKRLLSPSVLNEKSRNVSLNEKGELKGANVDPVVQAQLTELIGRFKGQALDLLNSIAPGYTPNLRVAPTSFRPLKVEDRKQSIRADDRRIHVDAFPSRPNYGERILRVFININPEGTPRVWRVGERFETVAERFLPRAKPYSAWQAKLLAQLRITKSVRSEYDHLMLQLHDLMKHDEAYQAKANDDLFEFAPGAVWVCYSDLVPHGVLSGQYMMEQTCHLQVKHQNNPEKSPLAILGRMRGEEHLEVVGGLTV